MPGLLLVLLACSGSDGDDGGADTVAVSTARRPTVFPDELPALQPEQAAISFLDWYAREAGGAAAPAWWAALRASPLAIAPALRDALREDSLASTRARGGASGLDYDPFVGTRSRCERYEVGETLGTGTARLIRVHGVCSGTRSAAADVILELVAQEGAWQLYNVHYPQRGGDLLGALEARRSAR